MKIGIDISQTQYEGTGVGQYLSGLVKGLLEYDHKNDYVLFFSSLRKEIQNSKFKIPAFAKASAGKQNYNSRVKIKSFFFPQTFLDLLWNRLHIFPIEWFIGEVDVFISSDWTQPPTKRAKKATILYDLIVHKYPQEMDRKIVQTHKRRLEWVKKECDMIFCISEATKKDAMEILDIDEKRLKVTYPGA